MLYLVSLHSKNEQTIFGFVGLLHDLQIELVKNEKERRIDIFEEDLKITDRLSLTTLSFLDFYFYMTEKSFIM